MCGLKEDTYKVVNLDTGEVFFDNKENAERRYRQIRTTGAKASLKLHVPVNK